MSNPAGWRFSLMVLVCTQQPRRWASNRFQELLAEFQERGRLLGRSITLRSSRNRKFPELGPLIEWLSYNALYGCDEGRKAFVVADGARQDEVQPRSTELAVNALEMSRHLDQIVCLPVTKIFDPGQAVQRHGVRVTVVSTIAVRTP